ncbi:MAG: hypothetical protein VYE68_05530 [Acidobacteriota bacterium]|nr:hypothetical protein [Acidobacteriota bacterium]
MSQRHLADLRQGLARVRRRWLAARWMRGLARVVVGALLALLVVLATDRWASLPDVPMLWTVALAGLAALLFGIRVGWGLRERPSDRRVARFVEEQCPEFEDRVVSAAEVEAARRSVFQPLVVADAVERLRGLDLTRVVSRGRFRRAVGSAGVAVGALVVVMMTGVVPISRVVSTAWVYAFPSQFRLEVEPGDVRLVAGQPLRVRARLVGGGDQSVRTAPTLSLMDGGRRRDVLMRQTEDGYLVQFPAVDRNFTYRIALAGVASRDYRVDALVPPGVRTIDVAYTYPAFTGRAARVEEDGGDVFAPVGTTVQLSIHPDIPLASGYLVFGDGQTEPLTPLESGVWRATLVVASNDSYHVEITSRQGLTNPAQPEYVIRANADQPPDVRIERPGADREVTPLEEVPIDVRAWDDYQVGAMELVYQVSGRSEQTLPFPLGDPAAVVTGTRTLFIEELDVEAGAFITYYARAREGGLGDESRQARSDIFFLEIRRFDNEFEEAQSQGAMAQDIADLQKLAAQQKQIIVATWRLDEDPNRLGLHDDLDAVADAQQELRLSATGAAKRVRGRGRQRAAGDTGLAAENRAMVAAVDAMTAAETALRADDTGQALPHEMEALDQLLTAQAAIRRKQVSTQRSQGSGAAGGQAQLDLSALFDRELRREQETSYETSRRPGPDLTENESEALRRLRELAERQARLNREVSNRRDAAMTDEQRRTLERLRRDQQELRAQLEELIDQLSRASGSEDQTRSNANAELQRVADQMQRSMSGLRRRDPSTAQEYGQEALEALRRVERGLRDAGTAGAVGRLGELQLEAQRLAAAQRRLGGPETRSQNTVADEQDALADRVDALDDGMSDLVDVARTGQIRGAPEVEAARDLLARGAIAGRMRAEAERGRRADDDIEEANGSSPGARGEQQALAEELAAVARLLEGALARDDVQQRRAAQLGAARELRERLEQLEREVNGEGRRAASESGAQSEGRAESSRPGRPGPASTGGREPSEGAQTASARNGQRSGRLGVGGAMRAASRLQAEVLDPLEQQPGLLEALQRSSPELARHLERWAEEWRSVSASGTQASKLDYGEWVSLRRDLVSALQQFEAEQSSELASQALRDRYAAGIPDTVPEQYRVLVDEYYRALATTRSP